MHTTVSALIEGVSLGGVYALIGLGLVLAFRATETFNFAHGQYMLLPAFLVGMLTSTYGFSLWSALLLSLVMIGVVGAVIYRLVLKRTTGLPVFMGVIATLGVASVLDGVMGIVFGINQYDIPIGFLPRSSIVVAGVTTSWTVVCLAAFSFFLALLVALTVQFSRFGRHVRAAGQDPILASLGGINVPRMYLISWFVAAVLAGIAGITYAATNVVDSSLENIALLAFPAVLLGGLDSIWGAIVGGLIVGVVQGFVDATVGGGDIDAITYGLLLVIILVLPQGLFGTKQIARL
jgi:branched-chain amino acid transport system permease protein